MDAIPLLRTWAQELGLDLKQFQKDMENPDTYAAVRAQQQQGQDAGIRGTPSVFINGKAFSDIQSEGAIRAQDRKSTRLNSSHVAISYAVFCLKKKTTQI